MEEELQIEDEGDQYASIGRHHPPMVNSGNDDFSIYQMQQQQRSANTLRSKILLYQKPMTGTTGNLHNNNFPAAHTLLQAHQESSVVSSISNTALGTLYQGQNNRLQSQYFSSKDGQPGKMGQRNARFQGTSSSIGDNKPTIWSRRLDSQAPTSAQTGTFSSQPKNLMRASGTAYGSAPRNVIPLGSNFGDSQIKPVTAETQQQRRRIIATAGTLQRRPVTMGQNADKNNNYSSSGHVSYVDQQQIQMTMSETDLLSDPRKAMKFKRQKLQQGFYDTLKQGQLNDPAQRKASGMALGGGVISQGSILDQNQSDIQQSHLKAKMQLSFGGGAALSLKTNNLKYHLMRDLLQKKSLDEIMQLKQRLIQTTKVPDNRRTPSSMRRPAKKEIRISGPKFTTVSTNPIAASNMMVTPGLVTSRSSSKSSASEEDDAEPFDMSLSQQQPPDVLPNASLKEPSSTDKAINKAFTSQSLGGMTGPSLGPVHNSSKGVDRAVSSQLREKRYDDPENGDLSGAMNLSGNFNVKVASREQLAEKRSVATANTTRRQVPWRPTNMQNDLSLIAAHRHEEKRLSQPFHLQDEKIPVEDQMSMITRYNYRGLPQFSRSDQRAVPVKLRKKKQDDIAAMENFNGCRKFNTRQTAHHQHNFQSPNSMHDLLSNQTLSPFLEETAYGQEERLLKKNNQLKQQAFATKKQYTTVLSASYDEKSLKQNVELAELMNQNMGVDAMLAKEKRIKYDREMNRAKAAVAFIKRSRIEEGPESSGVFKISQMVGKVVTQRDLEKTDADFDATAALSKGELNDKIRKCISEENKALYDTYHQIGSFESVYKARPGIIPIWGAEAVKVEPIHGHRRGRASLQDLVVTEQMSGSKSIQHFHQTSPEPLIKVQAQDIELDPGNPFVKWGTINTSLQKILNTQKFGDIYTVTVKEETMIKEFLMTRYPELKENQVQFKIGKVSDTDYQESLNLPSQMRVYASQFNIVFYGKHCPLSRCCRLSLCLCICGITSTAKINCMASAGVGGGGTLSHYNPQQQFPLEIDLQMALFPHRQQQPERVNENLVEALNSARSSNRQQQQIDSGVQWAIIAGQHKFQSLRAVAAQKVTRKKRSKKRMSQPDMLEEMSDDENIDDIFCDNDNVDIDMDQMMSAVDDEEVAEPNLS